MNIYIVLYISACCGECGSNITTMVTYQDAFLDKEKAEINFLEQCRLASDYPKTQLFSDEYMATLLKDREFRSGWDTVTLTELLVA